MKIYYSILLLLCIALKPVYFTSYVSYFELNKEYIIKKYCVNKSKPKLKCNGKCHLSKQLTVVTTAIDNSYESQFKALLSGFKNIFTPLYFSEISPDFDPLVITKYYQEFDNIINKKYSFYPTTTCPPPRV